MNLPAYKFLTQLKQIHGVEKIWLFGSRARGNARARSDIDLAITLSPSLENPDKAWLSVLDVIEHADTLLHIDCVNFNEIVSPELYQSITTEGRLL